MLNEINLLPGKTKHTSPLLKKRAMLHFIAIGALFTVSFSSIVLFILIALSPLPSLQQREKSEMRRLSFFSEMILKIQLTKERLTNVDNILQKRPVYSKSLKSIKDILPQGAIIEGVSLNEKALSITITSSSLSSLDKFIKTITEKESDNVNYKKIILVSIEQNFEKGKYVLTLELT